MQVSHPNALQAQSVFDAIRYTNKGTAYDARAIGAPGLGFSRFNGAGTAMDNPAAVGFTKDSFFDFSLGAITAQGEGNFLQNTYSDNNGRPVIGNLHYAYRFPTVQGSLVIGGGYARAGAFDRYINATAFNDTHSMTDFFAQNDYYYGLAFQTFAVDTLSDGYPESALRIDGFQGIDQNLEVIEQGQLGEWNLYSALEVQKGLMVGLSVGYQTGSYRYRRNLTEIDLNDAYTFEFTDYDVNFIELEDRIDADIRGFVARLGVAYSINRLHIGASVELPSNLTIQEDFGSSLTTIFDRVETSEPTADISGNTEYDISRPMRFKLGASVEPIKNLVLSGAVELTDFSAIEMDRLEDPALELQLNRFISQELQDVNAYHAAIEYTVPMQFALRAGYSKYESPERATQLTAQDVFSLGSTFEMYGGWQLNLGMQISLFEDEYVGYEAFVTNDPTLYRLLATENIQRTQLFVGLNYRF
jgi:hypothetical protein